MQSDPSGSGPPITLKLTRQPVRVGQNCLRNPLDQVRLMPSYPVLCHSVRVFLCRVGFEVNRSSFRHVPCCACVTRLE